MHRFSPLFGDLTVPKVFWNNHLLWFFFFPFSHFQYQFFAMWPSNRENNCIRDAFYFSFVVKVISNFLRRVLSLLAGKLAIAGWAICCEYMLCDVSP